MATLSDLYMAQSASRFWGSLCPAAKATLEWAFQEALNYPPKINQYSFGLINLQVGPVELHKFKIGYATFLIAVVPMPDGFSCPVLLDMQLDDEQGLSKGPWGS